VCRVAVVGTASRHGTQEVGWAQPSGPGDGGSGSYPQGGGELLTRLVGGLTMESDGPNDRSGSAVGTVEGGSDGDSGGAGPLRGG